MISLTDPISGLQSFEISRYCNITDEVNDDGLINMAEVVFLFHKAAVRGTGTFYLQEVAPNHIFH